VGNSLGGYLSLQLAARGRAETVVALAPAGGWAEGDESYRDTLSYFTTTQDVLKEAAPHAEKIVASPEGRRRATAYITVNFEHIPAALLAHQIRGAASCDAVLGLIEHALREACSGGSARRPRADQSTRPRNPNRLLTGRGGRRSSVGAAPHAQMTSRSISDHRPALGDV
jgi:pimeloyl-ACP methyl ester carboxylesterase